MFLVEHCRTFLVEEPSLVLVIIIVTTSFTIRSMKLLSIHLCSHLVLLEAHRIFPAES